MTTWEQIWQNRAVAEVKRESFRRMVKLLKSHQECAGFKFSLEHGTAAGLQHGIFIQGIANIWPGVTDEFNVLTTRLRSYWTSPLLKIQLIGNTLMTPDPAKTLPYYQLAGYAVQTAPPPIDNVPPTDQIPETCTICGSKEYIA